MWEIGNVIIKVLSLPGMVNVFIAQFTGTYLTLFICEKNSPNLDLLEFIQPIRLRENVTVLTLW